MRDAALEDAEGKRWGRGWRERREAGGGVKRYLSDGRKEGAMCVVVPTCTGQPRWRAITTAQSLSSEREPNGEGNSEGVITKTKRDVSTPGK